MNESSHHNTEGNGLAHQERVLIEDYRGPLNATATGSAIATLPPNRDLAPLRWPDEPSAAAIAALPTGAEENRRFSTIDVFNTYDQDKPFDWAVQGILWPFAALPLSVVGVFIVGVIGSLLRFFFNMAWSSVPAGLVKWGFVIAPLTAVIAGLVNSVRAAASLRRSQRRFTVLVLSLVGLAISGLFLFFLLVLLNYDFNAD